MTARLLHLLRHGEPELAGCLLGRTDSPPISSGIAACLDRVDGLSIDHIVSSDLARARLAAEAIGRSRAVQPSVDPRWRELDFGEWDGLSPANIDAAALSRFWSDPDRHAPPGGERWSAIRHRVGRAIEDLPAPSTLVVTHAGAVRAALSVLCGLTLPALWAFDLSYGALLSIRIWPGDAPSAQIIGLRQ